MRVNTTQQLQTLTASQDPTLARLQQLEGAVIQERSSGTAPKTGSNGLTQNETALYNTLREINPAKANVFALASKAARERANPAAPRNTDGLTHSEAKLAGVLQAEDPVKAHMLVLNAKLETDLEASDPTFQQSAQSKDGMSFVPNYSLQLNPQAVDAIAAGQLNSGSAKDQDAVMLARNLVNLQRTM